MKICFAASECFPYVKTGGLGDVAGSLPKSLSEEGCEVKVFLPLYGGIKTTVHNILPFDEIQNVSVRIGNRNVKFSLRTAVLPDSDIKVYFIDCPEYFQRDMPYTDDSDEDERFILFQIAVIESLQRLKWAPDIIHCNDWQTSLIPVYLKTNYKWDKLFENTRTLLSIHNIAYQGRFSQSSIFNSGLSYSDYYPGGPFELNGAFCFLKAGILFADLISTVSPTYAAEIQTEEFGCGLEGVLQSRSGDIFGVLNGIDDKLWNPETDKLIPYNYSHKNTGNKILCKKELLKEAELTYDEKIPTIGIISRFAAQKGFELLFPIANELMKLPFQLLVLGSGESKTEDFFNELKSAFPEKVNSFIGYNNRLAHHITAGCDIFLMPSKYEPCGLNQMYSLIYGTVPLVRKTGGLADTVSDFHETGEKGNGFSFKDHTPGVLLESIERALYIYKDQKIWKKIMKRGMKEDFTWKHSAKIYLDLYKKCLNKTE